MMNIKNMFLVGAHLCVRPGRHAGLPLRVLFCLFFVFALSGCKINLNIFGFGTVETTSGSVACVGTGTYDENNNPIMTGNCTETYNIGTNDQPCSGANCTTIEENGSVTETFAATANQGEYFAGWSGGCWLGGAGICDQEITYDDAQENEVVEINAAFEPEPLPQDASYTYNYLGQRASKTLNGATTYYLYDEQGKLLDEVDEEGHAIKAYIYMEGEYVAHIEESADLANNEESNEQLFYPINDHLGQPVQVWRADMNLAHEQYTDPFGNLYASYTNGTGAMGVTHAQTVAFPGQQRDVETGYSYNWNRTYDPTTGYTQSDPIGLAGGMNTFAYVGQNPVNWSDPEGLDLVPVFSPTGGATGLGQVGAAGGEATEIPLGISQLVTEAALTAGGGAALSCMRPLIRICLFVGACGEGYGNLENLDQIADDLARRTQRASESIPPSPTTSLPK